MTKKMQSENEDELFPEVPLIGITPFVWLDEKDIPRRPPMPGYKSWATNEVECRGDPLDQPIIWQGEQWAVTPYGIERRDGLYAIKAEDLRPSASGQASQELNESPGLEDCQEQGMRANSWADVAEFRVAMAIALDYFGRELKIPGLRVRVRRVVLSKKETV